MAANEDELIERSKRTAASVNNDIAEFNVELEKSKERQARRRIWRQEKPAPPAEANGAG